MATLIGPVVNESGFLLRLPDHLRMSEDDFFEFCAANRDLRIERTAEGDILIMAPAGIRTGGSNSGIIAQLWDWADQDGTGMAFDSNTGFTLPNGSVYSPDAAWILNARLEELPEAEIVRFGHICPDFVIELKSPSDSILFLQRKMEEYIENGVRLGWLIDPDRRDVHLYRPGQTVELIENASSVPGDPELPGFTLNLTRIWRKEIRRGHGNPL